MASHREPIRARAIIRETFVILFHRFGYVLGFAILPALALGYLEFLRAYPSELSGPISIAGEPSASGRSNAAALMTASMVARSLVIGLVAASMAQLVYRLKTGQSIAIGNLLSAITRSFPRTYVILLLLLVGIGVTAGIFTVAGLYLSSFWGSAIWIIVLLFYPVVLAAWALFGLAVPVSPIERLWIGAFARSLNLTKDYRWRCLGIFVVVAIAGYLILVAMELIIPLFGSDFGSRTSMAILSVATYVLLPACLTIAATLIYVRLLEIKEGGMVEDVFA